MKVIAFVGESGTGKSHRAIKLAHRYGLNAVIDDGLLILDGKILAGVSAKQEVNRMKAVRRAIFSDEEHAREVREAIKNSEIIKGILLLGTSLNMIEKITTILDIPYPEKIINIEDITSERDRHYARMRRQLDGEHVVPLPYIELKETWSGMVDRTFDVVIDQIRFGKRRRRYDKTIVKTKFSYLGEIKIKDDALIDICKKIISDHDNVDKVDAVCIVRDQTDVDGRKCVKIAIRLVMKFADNIIPTCKLIQAAVKENVTTITSLYIGAVAVVVIKVVRCQKISTNHKKSIKNS